MPLSDERAPLLDNSKFEAPPNSATAPPTRTDAAPTATDAPPINADAPPPVKKQGLCVLRPFKRQDELAVKDIISEATMETVGEFFWGAVLSEIFPQVAFTAVAIGFVGLGLPFYFCLALVPVAVVLMYLFIWSAHMIKVLELHSDLSNIPQSYQQEPRTGFWVAEVFDSVESSELAAHMNVTNKVIYEFIDQEALDKRGDNLAVYKQRNVVACVAVTLSNNSPSRAWLRRFAVKKDYQRRAIATNLLECVLAFCREKEFKGIELITTDCHHKARRMYQKAGFEVTMNNRYFLNVPQPTYMFSLSFKLPNKPMQQQGQNQLQQPGQSQLQKQGLSQQQQQEYQKHTKQQ